MSKKYTVTFSRVYEYDKEDLQPEPSPEQAIAQAWKDFENDMMWMSGDPDTFSAKVSEATSQ